VSARLKCLLNSVRKFQKKNAIEIHRAAHVQQDHDLNLLQLLSLVAQIDGFTAAADVPANRAAEVDLGAEFRDLETSRQPPAHLLEKALSKPLKHRLIARGHLAEVSLLDSIENARARERFTFFLSGARRSLAGREKGCGRGFNSLRGRFRLRLSLLALGFIARAS
jgi:hypothetical protein